MECEGDLDLEKCNIYETFNEWVQYKGLAFKPKTGPTKTPLLPAGIILGPCHAVDSEVLLRKPATVCDHNPAFFLYHF